MTDNSIFPLFLKFEEFRCQVCDDIYESGTVLVSSTGKAVFLCENCVKPVEYYRDIMVKNTKSEV